MIFKVDWERAHQQCTISEHIVRGMLESVDEPSNLQSIRTIDGGCANLNIFEAQQSLIRRIISVLK